MVPEGCTNSGQLGDLNQRRNNMAKQWYEERGEELTKDLRRVADAMEEILRLVKLDQEKFQKLNEKK